MESTAFSSLPSLDKMKPPSKAKKIKCAKEENISTPCSICLTGPHASYPSIMQTNAGKMAEETSSVNLLTLNSAQGPSPLSPVTGVSASAERIESIRGPSSWGTASAGVA
jgi:hypothetical protein